MTRSVLPTGTDLRPARPEEGGPGAFSGRSVPQKSGGYACPCPINPPSRHRSVPCPPGGWRPRHVLRRFCALPAQRLVVQARSAAIMCPARPEEGGSGTFCSGYVPCAPEGGRPWHVLRLFCAPDATRMAVLTRSAAILCPARPKVGGPGTFSGHSVPCLP